MARPRAADFLQLFKFKVVETAQGTPKKIAVAGFNTISMPEFSTPEVIYREGTFKFTKKQPGIPEFSNVIFRKGIARRESGFFNWIKDAVDGREYRTDLSIYHFHGSEDPASDQPTMEYILKEALPVRFRPSDDLDASSGEVAMEELEVAFEELVVIRHKQDQPAELT